MTRLSYALIAAAGILILTSSCKNKVEKSGTTSADSTSSVSNVPKTVSYTIVKEYPHDPHAFTEGLEFRDGVLYESIGQYGHSDLRKTSLETGNVEQQQKLQAKYFGEGITILNGKIYQLTYKEHTGFVYDQKTLKLLQTFTFPNQEGWGMTNDGKSLIYSDGSDILTYMDPVSLKPVKQVSVKDQYGPLTNINELEYVNGYIYANVWQVDMIVKIDPSTGNVVARVDCSSLRRDAGIPAPSADENAPEVMNGIAYDAEANRFFITGKNWPKLFEVKLDN